MATFGVMSGITALVAVLVAGVVDPEQSARVLGFAFQPRSGSVVEAATILATNLHVAGALIVLGEVRTIAARLASTARIAVVAILAGNVVVVGAAVGSYGLSVLPWLPHVPIEWLALACSAMSAVATRGSPALDRACAGVAAVVLLTAAAAIESYLTPL